MGRKFTAIPPSIALAVCTIVPWAIGPAASQETAPANACELEMERWCARGGWPFSIEKVGKARVVTLSVGQSADETLIITESSACRAEGETTPIKLSDKISKTGARWTRRIDVLLSADDGCSLALEYSFSEDNAVAGDNLAHAVRFGISTNKRPLADVLGWKAEPVHF